MVIRTVNFTVDATGAVMPALPQYGGVKGEHKATALSVTLAAGVYGDGDIVRLLFTGGDGAVVSSDILTDAVIGEDGTATLSYALPRLLTVPAGQLCVRVVVSTVDGNGDEVQTFCSNEAVLYFDGAEVENGTPFWTGVSELLSRTVAASQKAVAAGESAAEDVVSAQAAAAEAAATLAGKMTYKGDISASSFAMLTKQATGDLYHITTNNSWQLWDGTAWVSFSTVGPKGDAGEDGLSAFEIAQNNGFEGAEEEWLASLKGADGESPTVTVARDEDLGTTIVAAINADGTTSRAIIPDGKNGANGLSAYEIAVDSGTFLGDTEEEWLESLKGCNGTDGTNGLSAYEIAVVNGFEGTQAEWVESLHANTDTLEAEVKRLRESLSGILTVTHLVLSESATFDSSVSGTDINLLPNGETVTITDGVSYTDWTKCTYNGGTHRYIHVAVSAQSPFNICFMDASTVSGETQYISICEDFYTALGLTANDLVNGYIPAGSYTAAFDITGYYTYHGIYPDDDVLTFDGIAYNPTSVVGINGKDGVNGTNGKSAYEIAVDNGYLGTEEEFGAGLARVSGEADTNLFSFADADDAMAWFSKTAADTAYVYGTDGIGYKDTANGMFVFNSPENAGHCGITGGFSAALNAGSYKVSAELCIPTNENSTRTVARFGMYTAPSVYAQYAEYDLGALDTWIEVEKVITVADGDTTYIYLDSYIDNYPIYIRDIKVLSLNPEQTGWEGKKWVAVGDSITEKNSKTAKNYHDYIAEATGITVENLGLSGAGYKNYDTSNGAFYQRIAADMPSDADVVTIFGGGNDLDGSYTLGEVSADNTDTDTLCGCINAAIDAVYAKDPTVQLGIITSIPWGAFNPAVEDDSNLMWAYNNAIVEICRLRGVPCLDLYHCSGLRPWDETFLAAAYPVNSAGDGYDTVHPNEVGHGMIAPRIKAFLESLIL